MWITDKNAKFSENALYVFKKNFNCNNVSKAMLKISADARYKLYVNGKLVCQGPCKAAENEKYYDEADIKPYLCDGENEIFVRVLQLKSDDTLWEHNFLFSVFRSGYMLLFAQLELCDADGERTIETDRSWLCTRDDGVTITTPVILGGCSLTESVDGEKFGKYTYSQAREAVGSATENSGMMSFGIVDRYYMKKRPIPLLYLKKKQFIGLDGNDYDAGVLEFGYPKITFTGIGKAKITYAECYGHPGNKADRTDKALGLSGDFDTVTINGELTFEPFWYRTFRYIRIECDGVSVKNISYTETGYPHEIRDNYKFSNKENKVLWDISIRTLQRCTKETYEDCPYYEQLQYQMDTSLQMLFNYQITSDERLARQAIYMFAASQSANGLMTSRYPALQIQYIPTFSLFFIFMLHCHYVRFGDKELIKDYLPAAEGVLRWFERLEDKNGLMHRVHFWNFIDWADGWGDTAGAPKPNDESPCSLPMLMISYCSTLMAELYDELENSSRARQLRERAEKLNETVRKFFFDSEKKMFADDIKHGYISEHAQVWAVLSGAVDTELGREMLCKCDGLSCRSTFAFAWFLFRAYEKCGIYEKSSEIMNKLRALPAQNCTTIPETPHHSRSECHAWGSIALYEFTNVLLGVKADTRIPYITVSPRLEEGESAEGSVFTYAGEIFVRASRVNGKTNVEVNAPEGTDIRIDV